MWLKGMYKCFTNQRYIPSEEGSLSSLYLVFLAVCNGRGCLSLWMQMEHDMGFCSCWDISSFNMLMCCAGQHPDANKTSNLKVPMCKKLSCQHLCWGEWVSFPVSWRKELFSICVNSCEQENVHAEQWQLWPFFYCCCHTAHAGAGKASSLMNKLWIDPNEQL